MRAITAGLALLACARCSCDEPRWGVHACVTREVRDESAIPERNVSLDLRDAAIVPAGQRLVADRGTCASELGEYLVVEVAPADGSENVRLAIGVSESGEETNRAPDVDLPREGVLDVRAEVETASWDPNAFIVLADGDGPLLIVESQVVLEEPHDRGRFTVSRGDGDLPRFEGCGTETLHDLLIESDDDVATIAPHTTARVGAFSVLHAETRNLESNNQCEDVSGGTRTSWVATRE